MIIRFSGFNREFGRLVERKTLLRRIASLSFSLTSVEYCPPDDSQPYLCQGCALGIPL